MARQAEILGKEPEESRRIIGVDADVIDVHQEAVSLAKGKGYLSVCHGWVSAWTGSNPHMPLGRHTFRGTVGQGAPSRYR